MNDLHIINDLVKILFVFVLGTEALTITRRTLSSLFTTYAVQSGLIAIISLLLFTKTESVVLLLLALLTVASKAILIPYVLRRIQKSMKIRRDLEFRYLTPISSLLVSSAIIFLVYWAFSGYLKELSQDDLFFFGAVIGVSLTLIGMLIIITRKKMITKIVGYLTMENGVLLFSIFVAELPFIVELLIILDLVILIGLATVLAFGIDSRIEDFHDKLNSFTLWFKEKDD
jgi:hydrogenase-4 component E